MCELSGYRSLLLNPTEPQVLRLKIYFFLNNISAYSIQLLIRLNELIYIQCLALSQLSVRGACNTTITFTTVCNPIIFRCPLWHLPHFAYLIISYACCPHH